MCAFQGFTRSFRGVPGEFQGVAEGLYYVIDSTSGSFRVFEEAQGVPDGFKEVSMGLRGFLGSLFALKRLLIPPSKRL